MKRFSRAAALVVAFLGGFFCHFLYQRWNPWPPELSQRNDDGQGEREREKPTAEPQSHRVSFAPLSSPVEARTDPPLLQAREVDRIRALAGTQARVRGRIFRVGHSAKSNTYFLNFGPSREALTAVIFASGVELFAKEKRQPKNFEGKEVEVTGEIKDHPQYGLEVIIEGPAQIKVLN